MSLLKSLFRESQQMWNILRIKQAADTHTMYDKPDVSGTPVQNALLVKVLKKYTHVFVVIYED